MFQLPERFHYHSVPLEDEEQVVNNKIKMSNDLLFSNMPGVALIVSMVRRHFLFSKHVRKLRVTCYVFNQGFCLNFLCTAFLQTKWYTRKTFFFFQFKLGKDQGITLLSPPYHTKIWGLSEHISFTFCLLLRSIFWCLTMLVRFNRLLFS